jgi:ABC-2 type transport system ATP-binding protein
VTQSPALRIRDLHKTYKDVHAVDGLTLEVATGECFGLLGPNGAGKTTTIEICEGLTEADSGLVEVLGLNWAANQEALRRRIGVSLQETQFSDKLTVEETLGLFRSFYGTGPTIDQLLRQVQLGDKRRGRVGQLSGGQRQRLALAVALVGSPELLFLDEPTTGLDPQSRRQLWDLIAGFRAEGRTVILTTHYMEEAERLCDRVAIVDRGRIIAEGTPRELISRLGAEQVIEVSVDGDGNAAAAADAIGTVAGVLDTRVEGGILSLRVERLHQSLPGMLEALARARLPMGELRTHAPTLEDVFVSLTGRHLRDE